jgi:MYXO-CTERM domain-containing protein
MKTTLLKLTATCALAFAMASGAQAQILANDPFLTGGSGYTVGGVSGQNPTVTGFNGAWGNVDGPGGTISSTPISYTAPTGYVETSGAGTLSQGNDYRSFRAFSSGVTSAFGATSGTLYISFELQLAGGVSGYQAAEISTTPDGYRFLQVGYSSAGDFANTTDFGITVNNTANGTTTGTFGAADSNAHLFVLQLNLASGANDTLNAWEDPTSLAGSAPTGGNEVSLSGFSVNGAINEFSLGSFIGSGSMDTELSEVRMGDTLADVAAVPEPSVAHLALLGFGALFLIRRRMIA